MFYFVEHLTLWTWASSIYPRLLKMRAGTGRTVDKCYFIDGSGFSALLASAMGKIIGVTVKRFVFRLADVHDESGLLSRLRVNHDELFHVQQYALGDPAFENLAGYGSIGDRLPIFLIKNLTLARGDDRNNIWRALFLMQVCNWQTRQKEDQGKVPVLFLERRPWHDAIARYATDRGLAIVAIRPRGNIRSTFRRRLPPWAKDLLRNLRYRRNFPTIPWYLKRRRGPRATVGSQLPGQVSVSRLTPDNSKPRVAAEYYGMLNLNQPERHSDLFFWQQSSLCASDLLFTYSIPAYPLNEHCRTELEQHGVEAVVLHPAATTFPDMPVFKHRMKLPRPRRMELPNGHTGQERAWLDRQYTDYRGVREYWTDLASTYNIKVYVSWAKSDGVHCAIADALQSLGGITAIYQRGFEDHSSTDLTVSSDIVFSYSPKTAEIGRQSYSSIRYHVATGYLGDHRSRLVQDNAQAVRERLKHQGAKNILAYFDENSLDDSRWSPGHHGPQCDYEFLLEKVLAEPWLGLVIKPKVPGTLRRRLGPVAQLLERAESTGRCYVFEAHPSSPFYSATPPVEAALAADVAIHGHLISATAGIEAALAGVPTLLLDREGWPVSPLYQLGVGTTVFTDWDQLWEACRDHWSSPNGTPGFGEWSSMLDQIDPFRDGRAAERMGTYIQWLIQGFKDGLDRETIMTNAAERYCAAWGWDKITEVNIGNQMFTPTNADANNPQLISR